MKKQFSVKNLVLAALFVALGYLLPMLTGQIPNIGRMLLPMHIPVILAGFVCGPVWGLLVGLILPLSRSFLLGMPPLFPTATVMTFELAAYGFIAGFLYQKLAKRKGRIILSLLGSMIGGRIVWGVVSKLIAMLFTKAEFSWAMFFAGAVGTALPGIVLQLILIPLLVYALEKAKLIGDNRW